MARVSAPTVLLSAALGLTAPLGAFCGPLLDAAIKAEQLAASGDSPAALAAIQSGMATFSQSLPLTIAQVHFVTEKPVAYRSYRMKPDSVFKPGEPLITYLEVIGLDWRAIDAGAMEAHFTVDMRLSDESGRDIALKQGFGDIRYAGQGMAQEVFTHLTLDVAGAKPGRYTLTYTVNDLVAERSAQFQQAFTIAGGP